MNVNICKIIKLYSTDEVNMKSLIKYVFFYIHIYIAINDKGGDY